MQEVQAVPQQAAVQATPAASMAQATPASTTQTATQVTPTASTAQATPASTTSVAASAIPVNTLSYSMDDLTRAAMTLMDAGKQANLQALLANFGVESLPLLSPEYSGDNSGSDSTPKLARSACKFACLPASINVIAARVRSSILYDSVLTGIADAATDVVDAGVA